MGLNIRVQECRVVLGCYGDDDKEPVILMGTCEGIQHLPDLVETMQAAIVARVGPRPTHDFFWDGSSVWHDEVIG
jgi:hypothetical protein